MQKPVNNMHNLKFKIQLIVLFSLLPLGDIWPCGVKSSRSFAVIGGFRKHSNRWLGFEIQSPHVIESRSKYKICLHEGFL